MVIDQIIKCLKVNKHIYEVRKLNNKLLVSFPHGIIDDVLTIKIKKHHLEIEDSKIFLELESAHEIHEKIMDWVIHTTRDKIDPETFVVKIAENVVSNLAEITEDGIGARPHYEIKRRSPDEFSILVQLSDEADEIEINISLMQPPGSDFGDGFGYE